MNPTLIAIAFVATGCYLIVTAVIVRSMRRARATRQLAAALATPTPVPPAAAVIDGTRVLLPGLGGLWIEVRRGQQVHTTPLVGNQVVIGTHDAADIKIEDPFVSRRHVSLRVLPDGHVRMTDLDSTNGTFVNGHKLETRVLEPGDEIRLGETSVRVFQLGAEVPVDLHRAA